MDGFSQQYSTGTTTSNTSGSSNPSPAAISPQQLQQQQLQQQQLQQLHQQQQSTGSPSQTLPPLQPGHPAMQQPPYGNYPPPPNRRSSPNTPGSTNGMASYPPPPQGQQGAARGNGASYPMMNNNPYPQQTYTSSAMLPQTTTAASHPQPIAPAPTPGAGGAQRPPVLRPMPAQGYQQQPQPGMPQQPFDPEPTHVVGSQGRRGILPSAPGRPQAAAGTAKTQIPAKDADGKYPCPHCVKTYLHAKHLKRHLLRHTGDRPYMCVLCRDTFSRSDILKRHFMKCSVRRGNPTGASHLSHPQAHVKKHAAAAQKALAEGDVTHINGMGSMPADGNMVPFGLIPQEQMNNLANDHSQLSRASSINRLDDNNRDRRSMPNSVMGATTRGGSFDQPYNGADVQNNMGANINPQLANYNIPPGQTQNGMQMFPGNNSDWSQMFQSDADPNRQNAARS